MHGISNAGFMLPPDASAIVYRHDIMNGDGEFIAFLANNKDVVSNSLLIFDLPSGYIDAVGRDACKRRICEILEESGVQAPRGIEFGAFDGVMAEGVRVCSTYDVKMPSVRIPLKYLPLVASALLAFIAICILLLMNSIQSGLPGSCIAMIVLIPTVLLKGIWEIGINLLNREWIGVLYKVAEQSNVDRAMPRMLALLNASFSAIILLSAFYYYLSDCASSAIILSFVAIIVAVHAYIGYDIWRKGVLLDTDRLYERSLKLAAIPGAGMHQIGNYSKGIALEAMFILPLILSSIFPIETDPKIFAAVFSACIPICSLIWCTSVIETMLDCLRKGMSNESEELEEYRMFGGIFGDSLLFSIMIVIPFAVDILAGITALLVSIILVLNIFVKNRKINEITNHSILHMGE